MNQRILELADRAAQEVPGTHMNIPDEFCTKFAELIVDEVYSYINNATLDDEPFPSRKDVKQHFGVEE
jgi:hypothetical protein